MQGFAVNMKKTHDNNIASVTPDPKKYMDDVKRLLADFE